MFLFVDQAMKSMASSLFHVEEQLRRLGMVGAWACWSYDGKKVARVSLGIWRFLWGLFGDFLWGS